MGEDKKLKSLKVSSETYQKIISCKTKIESEKKELVSFDKTIDHLLDCFDKKTLEKPNKDVEK